MDNVFLKRIRRENATWKTIKKTYNFSQTGGDQRKCMTHDISPSLIYIFCSIFTGVCGNLWLFIIRLPSRTVSRNNPLQNDNVMICLFNFNNNETK